MIWLTSCLLFVNCLYESQQDVYKDIILSIMLTSCYKDNILVDDVNKLLQRYYPANNVNKMNDVVEVIYHLQKSCWDVLQDAEMI